MDGRGIHTENGSPERRFIAWAAPAAIAVAAIFLRFFALGRDSLWFDELYNVWSARFPLADQMAEGLAAGHPPLYYLIARLWFAVGESEVWVRALSGLSGLLLVWLMYLLGRELFSRQAGLWAAALAAVSPVLVWYSRAATFYSLLFLLTALSLLFLARATIRGGGRNWAGYAAAMTAVYLTSFFAAVLQLAGIAAFWLLKGRKAGQAKTFLLVQAPLSLMALAALAASRYSVAEDTSTLTMPSLGSLYLPVKRAITAPLPLLAGDP
ncbi:MAG: glycosyltransferase family 39 protein [Thermoleophilia bacterium]